MNAPALLPPEPEILAPDELSVTASGPRPGPRVGGPVRVTESPVQPYRRRRGKKIRHRQQRLLAFGRALMTLLLFVGLPIGTATWVFAGNQFAVHQISVQESPRVAAGWIEEALRPLIGRNLLLLDPEEVRQHLLEHPWVASAAIRKQPPDRLEVIVVDRQPVALLEAPDQPFWVDRHGTVIAEATATELEQRRPLRIRDAARIPEDVLAALAMAAEYGDHAAHLAGPLRRIRVLGDGGFQLELEALPFPLLARPGDVRGKAAQLERFLPEIRARYRQLAAVDIRFRGRIVVQPEGAAPISGVRRPSRG